MGHISYRKFINISTETRQKQIYSNSGSKAEQFIGIFRSSMSAKDETNYKFSNKTLIEILLDFPNRVNIYFVSIGVQNANDLFELLTKLSARPSVCLSIAQIFFKVAQKITFFSGWEKYLNWSIS